MRGADGFGTEGGTPAAASAKPGDEVKPLLHKDNNRMCLGDAKKMLDTVLVAPKG